MKPPRPDDDDEPAREIVRADGPTGDVGGAAALARVIDQSNREAAASRAQARELIKALEGVQRSQEYLGVALREERAKSRWLAALVLIAPLVAVAGGWYAWRHVDDVRSDLDGRIARLAEDEQAARSKIVID